MVVLTKSHKDLIVWQKSMDLVTLIYKLTAAFPQSELYGLTTQMRRSAASIPSNIAEGRRRGSKGEYRHFLLIAAASGAELETQLEISNRLGFGDVNHRTTCDAILLEVLKMLTVIIKTFSAPSNP